MEPVSAARAARANDDPWRAASDSLMLARLGRRAQSDEEEDDPELEPEEPEAEPPEPEAEPPEPPSEDDEDEAPASAEVPEPDPDSPDAADSRRRRAVP
jgi:hypothetical protein